MSMTSYQHKAVYKNTWRLSIVAFRVCIFVIFYIKLQQHKNARGPTCLIIGLRTIICVLAWMADRLILRIKISFSRPKVEEEATATKAGKNAEKSTKLDISTRNENSNTASSTTNNKSNNTTTTTIRNDMGSRWWRWRGDTCLLSALLLLSLSFSSNIVLFFVLFRDKLEFD